MKRIQCVVWFPMASMTKTMSWTFFLGLPLLIRRLTAKIPLNRIGYKSTAIFGATTSVTRKKSPNVYKSCPKMISQEKSYILTTLQILPNNVRDLGKLIVAKVFKKLSKVQKFAQSGHPGYNNLFEWCTTGLTNEPPLNQWPALP